MRPRRRRVDPRMRQASATADTEDSARHSVENLAEREGRETMPAHIGGALDKRSLPGAVQDEAESANADQRQEQADQCG